MTGEQRDGEHCSLIHDKVQEAAYELIPQHARAAAHLEIGRALVAVVDGAELEERIFEVVNQFKFTVRFHSAPPNPPGDTR